MVLQDPFPGSTIAMVTASAYTNASDTLVVDRYLAACVAPPAALPRVANIYRLPV